MILIVYPPQLTKTGKSPCLKADTSSFLSAGGVAAKMYLASMP